MNICPVPLI